MVIQSSITRLNNQLRDRYFITLPSGEKKYPWIIKLNKVYAVENSLKSVSELLWYEMSEINIKASTYEVGWSEDLVEHDYKFTDRNIASMHICSYSAFDVINDHNVSNKIFNVLTSQGWTLIERDVIDHKLCKILFDNWPEVQWALSSKCDLIQSLEKISTVYNNSLDNELLSGYTEKTYKILKIIKNEIKKVDKYATEVYDAMRKSYEYLCVPSNMKTFEGISLDPLRVSLRQDEMRKSFDEVVKIQDEINHAFMI